MCYFITSLYSIHLNHARPAECRSDGETVKLNAFIHRNAECIGIHSIQSRLPSGENLNYYFQKKAGARWSHTNKCWYVPCTEKNYELLAKVLKGKAVLEVEELKKYLLEKKKNNRSIVVKKENIAIAKTVIIKAPAMQSKPAKQLIGLHKLSNENNEAFEKFKQQLVLKSYSASTIRTYTNEDPTNIEN